MIKEIAIHAFKLGPVKSLLPPTWAWNFLCYICTAQVHQVLKGALLQKFMNLQKPYRSCFEIHLIFTSVKVFFKVGITDALHI